MPKPTPQAEPSDVETAEVGQIEGVADSFDPDPYFASGDLRDCLLDVIRSAVDWGKFDEQRQRDINSAVGNAARDAVAKITRGIAAEGRTSFAGTIDTITLKDGVKLVVKCPLDPEIIVPLSQTKIVEIAFADPAKHQHERAPARVDPDQPDLLPTGTDGDQDLVDAADPDPTRNAILRTGDCIEIEGRECEVEVNLMSARIEATPRDGNAIEDVIDVRDATPEELAAERERTADFEVPSEAAAA